MQYRANFHKLRLKKLTQHKFIDLANAPDRSDEELFSEFIVGEDRELLGKIFRKYMTLVFGVCMKYMGEKKLAQDATMDIFEQLLKREITSEIKNFTAYLFVLSRNHCLMKTRSDKMVLTEITERDMELALEMHPLDTEEKISKALNKCLEQLKNVQKQCVDLFYLGNKSYLEISSELKMTLNAVKSNIQNGKRNLKMCIEDNR